VDLKRSVHEAVSGGALETIVDPAWTASLGVEAMNALSTGIALLDRRAYVLFANATAERLCKRDVIFKTSSPLPLALRDADSNETLHRAIAGACEGASAALQMRDVDANPVISAVVMPLGASQWTSSWKRPVVLLAMNELTRFRSIPDRWLSQLFGLTPTESSVTNWLVAGRSIDEYAQHRGVSLATVRSQLKAVLSKTGMSRQAQLVAALSRLPIEHVSNA
jgi:DNA-binding CsgD family transcriptional regulator